MRSTLFHAPSHHSASRSVDINLNPVPVVERLQNSRGQTFFVLREDRLIGGTKQRAARRYIALGQQQGVEEFCYASPFAGFAQVALSVCCSALGSKSRIFAERDKTQPTRAAHAFSRLAKDWGATLHLFESLNDAERAASVFSSRSPQSQKIPLGFDCPAYLKIFREEVAIIWSQLSLVMTDMPQRVWIPVGSGTLARTLRSALPASVALECLNVRILSPDDHRLAAVRALPNTTLRHVPELFVEPSGVTPPIPSNTHYDAKLWRYLRTEARPGDLWWNVAR